MAHLVLLETAGNQHYIFATNRLREVVGASEVIFSCGVDLVLAAVGYEKDAIHNFRQTGELKQLLESQKLDGIELLLVTSGKALVRVDDEDTGRKIVSSVTLAALKSKPGVTVRGAITKIAGDSAGDLHNAITEVHKKLAGLQARLPSNDLRFQRLPVVAECASSGLPASHVDIPASHVDTNAPSDAMRVISQVVREKRQHRNKGWERLTGYFGDMKGQFDKTIDELESRMQNRDARWIAIVHADGNGLGQIFMDFKKRCKLASTSDYRDYIDKYRNFSLAIEQCTLAAANRAVAQVWGKDKENGKKIGCIPVVLGGDDLTVICEGDKAVSFAQCYLEAFEEETGNNAAIKEVLGGDRCIAACAGIAIVKPHFPFHRAYELAEALVNSAKKVKQKVAWDDGTAYPCSALHYHVHFDSSGADFDNIRENQQVADDGILSVQPWVVSTDIEAAPGTDWIAKRKISDLWKGVETLSRKNEEDEKGTTGKPFLPRSQQHALRDALFNGVGFAEGKLQLIKNRYKKVWSDLLPQTGGNKLFFHEEVKQADGSEKTKSLSPLVDMMDLSDLDAKQPECQP